MARLPRGIVQTPTGWRISVRVKGVGLWQKRFPPSTSLETLIDKLQAARKTQRAGRRALVPGTLAADVQRYLTDYFTGRPGYAERTRHLDLWLAALGRDVARSAITRDDIARVLNGWRAQGHAADTCNKRRTALLALFHALDGKGGTNPVREVPKFRAPDPLPRGLSYRQIDRALRQLPRCKTRVRLAVIAATGLRHGQVMRLTPDCWDRVRHVLTVPGTAKGRGTKPYVLPLSARGTEALQAFDRADAWGRFTWAPMARMWKAAATKAKLPVGTVPYDLRHSFGTQVYRSTGDIKATQALLGHSSLRVTERYLLAAVPQRQRQAMQMAFPGRKLPLKVASRRKTA